MRLSRTRDIYLRSMCAIYMFAFFSLYSQIRGLYGINGILPAHTQLKLNSGNARSAFLSKPTLLWLFPQFGINTHHAMELLCLSGGILSFLGLVFSSLCTVPLFATLWLFYLSLYQVGQTFLWFQWDMLLLEAGIVTVIVAPLFWNSGTPSVKDDYSVFLVRWLLFRLMFASGVVKLTSQCPVWWDLGALNIHYESQCIPTPIAWYLHQFPAWLQRLSVVATFVIEIALPFFFIIPIRFAWERTLRLFSFYGQVLLQVMIIVSGNYNFFNLLTLVLCISLLDDDYWAKSRRNRSEGVLKRLAWFAIGGVLHLTVRYFGLRFNDDWTVKSRITFSEQEFNVFVTKATSLSLVLGVWCFGSTVLSSIMSCLRGRKSFLTKIWSLFTLCVWLIPAVMLFSLSFVPYTTLDSGLNKSMPPNLVSLYEKTHPWHLTGSYGLFRRMTGENGRPEVTLEVSDDLAGPWTELSFKYKPGNVTDAPQFIVPHQPRLDWQMWFAALGSSNPWASSLAYRILQGQPDVLALLNMQQNTVFRNGKVPTYIRGTQYVYRFTDDWNGAAWWKRERIGDWIPIFSASHKPLLDYLKKYNIIGRPDIKEKDTWVVALLDRIWDYVAARDPVLLLWGLNVSALLLIFY